MDRDIQALNNWSDEILKGDKPPAGFTPVPGSKVGLWHKKTATGWDYWRPSPQEPGAASIAKKLPASAARLLVVAVAGDVSSGYTGRSARNAPSATFYEARKSGVAHEAKVTVPVRNKLVSMGLLEKVGEHTRAERSYVNFGRTPYHMSAGDFLYRVTDKGRAVAAEAAKLDPELGRIYAAATDKVLRDAREMEIDKAPQTTAWRSLNGIGGPQFVKNWAARRETIKAGVYASGNPEAVAAFTALESDLRDDNPALSQLRALLEPEPFQR